MISECSEFALLVVGVHGYKYPWVDLVSTVNGDDLDNFRNFQNQLPSSAVQPFTFIQSCIVLFCWFFIECFWGVDVNPMNDSTRKIEFSFHATSRSRSVYNVHAPAPPINLLALCALSLSSWVGAVGQGERGRDSTSQSARLLIYYTIHELVWLQQLTGNNKKKFEPNLGKQVEMEQLTLSIRFGAPPGAHSGNWSLSIQRAKQRQHK